MAAGVTASARARWGCPQSCRAHPAPARERRELLARAHHGSVSKDQRAHHRRRPESGPPPLRCRDVDARTRNRHGRGRPGGAGRVAAIRRQRAAARSAAPATRSAKSPAACSSRSTAPTSSMSPSSASGWWRARSRRCAIPQNPLDILAQQTVAAVALEPIDIEEWWQTVRRSAPFATLPRSAYEATLDLLSGLYPSDEFAELRPRIVWDRVARLDHRPARRPAARGDERRHHPRSRTVRRVHGRGDGGRRRVGELDEEMVYESRVGDVIALGATSWRIEDITHDRVVVAPAFGQPGPHPLLEGRRPRTAGRARRGGRRVHP